MARASLVTAPAEGRLRLHRLVQAVTRERALAILEAAYGPDHPDVVRTLGNLGHVQQEPNDTE